MVRVFLGFERNFIVGLFMEIMPFFRFRNLIINMHGINMNKYKNREIRGKKERRGSQI